MRALVVAFVLVPGVAFAGDPHAGFTIELGFGFAGVHVHPSDGSMENNLGVGGPSLAAGAWITPSLTVTGRITAIHIEDGGLTDQYVFLGGAVQGWLTDQIFLAGGIGLGGIEYGRVPVQAGETIGKRGFGLSLRAGYNFNAGSSHALNLSIEAIPGIYPEELNLPVALLLTYQYR